MLHWGIAPREPAPHNQRPPPLYALRAYRRSPRCPTPNFESELRDDLLQLRVLGLVLETLLLRCFCVLTPSLRETSLCFAPPPISRIGVMIFSAEKLHFLGIPSFPLCDRIGGPDLGVELSTYFARAAVRT